MSVMERDQKYIANTYARFPLVLTEGKGVRVKDENGKEYIDLGSGIAVNTFGYADEHWVRAVSEQLTKLQHTSNLYYTEPAVALAQTLCERTGMKRCSSPIPGRRPMNAPSKRRASILRTNMRANERRSLH
jgi:acetylornithine/N-succinyldiaminopimelate aminotransferase